MFSIRIQTRTGWALFLLTALSASLSAQIAKPHAALGHRFNFDAAQKANRANLPSHRFALAYVAEKRLPALTRDELKPDTGSLATKAGVHRKLGADLDRFARWDVTPDGKYLWRLGIQSPEAAGLRFHIRGFHAGAGALWLHDGSGRESEIMGPYSGDGPFGDGEFWTDIVLSDTVVLEFQPHEAPKSAIDPPPFEIVEISHLLPQALAAGQQLQAAANCHLDATCYPEWATTAKSVGHIVFEKSGAAFVCSGTLLATQRPSGIPYFLTADHCIPDEAVARTMQVFWMYETSACNGAPPSNKLNLPRSLGARYLTGGGMGRGDFTLVQLTSVPDTVVFSGWDTTEPEIGTRLTGIHHPDGDYKRISFGQRVPAQQGLSGTDPDYYYSVAYADGRTEGGSSGSGVFVRPGVLVGTLTWGPKQQGPNWVCQFQPEYTGYGRFSTHYPSLRQYLEGPATPGQPTPTPGDSELTSGRALQVSLPASPTATLYTRYFIRVPQGATSLQISLNVNAEVGVAVSAGEPPKVVDGRVTADYLSAGTTGRETVVVNQASSPPLRAGVYYIGLANFTVNQAATGTLVATVQTGGQGPNTPIGSGRLLTSGVAANFTFAPVQNPTLMNGAQGFRIEVPQGATRLEIRLATTTANADVDLYGRHGRDVGLDGSDLIADYVSDSPSGYETIVITPQSSPALQAGVYYIGLGILAQNIATTGSVTATVTSDANTPPPAGGNALTSGVPRQFNVAAVDISTLFYGTYGFRVEVPQGATRLDIRLSTDPSNVDIDLYARLGQDVALNAGELEMDYDSSGPDGNELISITPQSNPPLRPGTYFIAFGVFTKNVPARAMVTATVTGGGGTTPPPSAGRVLTSGTPVTFFADAQPRETLLNGRSSYTIQVPQGATRLEIKLNTRPSDFDIDLFARAGADPVVGNDGRVVADHSSTGPAGTETIVITTSSNPPLKAGTYYITLGVWTTNRPASGTLVATVETAGSGATSTALRSGVPASFSFPAVDGATLKTGGNGFYIDVPTGTTRLDVRLNTATAGADLDLFVRVGQDVGVENGKLVADFGSDGPTGSEAITISATSTPPLRPGRYYVGIVIYTTGVPVSGTVTAAVTNVLDRPSGFVALEVESEGTARIALPAASTPYLYAGPYSYKLTVPEGVTGVKLDLRTETPGADIDLYIRYLDNVELKDGRVIADHGAFGDTGDETLVIDSKSSPPLRPGVYYIAFANLTANTEVHATLAVSFERSSMPPQSSARLLEPDKPARFDLPAVTTPSLFHGEQAFRMTVPVGTGQLVIKLRTDNLANDVDLFVRYGEEATVDAGRMVADYSSTGDNGEEEIVIHNPKAGVYFVNLALYTTGVGVQGTLTASLSSAASGTSGTQMWKTASAAAHGGEPVAAKPAGRAVSPLGADAKRQAPPPALSLRPASPKEARFKKLIPLTSFER